MRLLSSALAAALVAGVIGCRGGESTEPPVHLVRNMDTQRKGKAYRKDASGLFADGRVMRAPIEGTIAQGSLNEDAVFVDGLAADGQPSLKYPASVQLDDAFRARGKNRYNVYCTPCHGAAFDGKGPVASRGLQIPPPSFLDPRIKAMPLGRIYRAIKLGVNNDNMPSYASQIPELDRWAIVAAVRAEQMRSDPSVAEEGGQNIVVAKASRSSVEHGKQLFAAKACSTCHSLDGSRLVGPTFKGLWGRKESTSAGEVTVDDAYLRESMLQPAAKIVTDFPPAMPLMPLDDVEVQSLILFIKSQK
ncbi:MAG: c-type cytochrome [Myxococcaceae bacterium]